MCRPATCRTCGKTTWAGCGQHVDQVMARVPRGDRCPGHPEAPRAASASFLSRVLGRGGPSPTVTDRRCRPRDRPRGHPGASGRVSP